MLSQAGSGSDGLEIHNHNLENESYKAEISSNMKLILDKFKQKLNKNENDTIKAIELFGFLDSCYEVRILKI
jgi:hypothetical protein